jgi:hypothetical protein
MVFVSVNSTGKLFNLLNSKNSKFHFQAIFFNIRNINLSPGLQATQNFIIMMKHYFYQIEYEHFNNLKYDQTAKPNTCL